MKPLYRLNLSHQSSVHSLILSDNGSIKIHHIPPGALYEHSQGPKNPCSPTVLWLLRAPYTGTLTYPAARGPSPQLLGISFKIQDEISLVEGRDLFLSPAFYIFLSTPFSLPGPSCLSGALPSNSQSYFIIVLWKCLYNSYDTVILDSC